MAGLAVVLALTGALPASSVTTPAPSATVAGPSDAPTAPAVAPVMARPGRPIDRLTMSRLLRQVVAAGGLGAVAEVDSEGREWRGAAGRSFLRPSRPAVPGARFRAASISKLLMTVLALQLVNRGRWTLDTTIGDVLPGLWPGRGEVTLRQLLSHTSGLPDYLTPITRRAARSSEDFVRALSLRRTDRGLVARARSQPFTGLPGEAYSYSNTNFVIVGLMLRRATQQPLRRLLTRRVFRPAGMTQSRWPTAPGLPRPQLHEYFWGGGAVGWLDLGSSDPTLFSGAGALVSTTRDLNRFQRALSSGRILPRRLLGEMRSVQAVDPVAGQEYGLGSYRLPDPCSDPAAPTYVYGHDGATFGTLSFTLSSPDGRRRATAAFNGRNNLDQAPLIALIRVVYAGMASACGQTSAFRADRAWPPSLLTDSSLLRVSVDGG